MTRTRLNAGPSIATLNLFGEVFGVCARNDAPTERNTSKKLSWGGVVKPIELTIWSPNILAMSCFDFIIFTIDQRA